MAKKKKTVEEVVEYIVDNYGEDVFYDDIVRNVRNAGLPDIAFGVVATSLRAKGLWVHS